MEERIVAPDPVAEPQAYQQALLDLLGGRDMLEVLAATPERFAEQTDGLSDEVLTRRPEPKEWSAHELLGHLFDAEIVYAFRWRLTLAQDGVAYPGYDQDAWAELHRPEFADMLASYRTLRATNIELVRNTSEELWDRSGLHAERGPESFRLAVQLIAGHDLAHIKQLEQTLDAVR